ncbi:hypothetical protein [uncultured Sphingomonas sp.]|uniref:hypothetical protein n=1 Tax=uncultured Sphingomonas sp. TaxID=158754 RepID=UPI0035CC0A61
MRAEHIAVMGQTRRRGNIATIVSVLALGMAWPVLIYGSVGYGYDSSGYYRGGRAAVRTAFGAEAVAHAAPKMNARSDANRSPDAPDPVDATGKPRVGGLRSIVYSIATYILSWPGVSLAPLVVAQLLALVGLVVVLLDVRRHADRLVPMLAASGVLIVGSTLPIFATTALPDVFAGAMIAALAGLVTGEVRGHAARGWLAALVIAAVAAHQSHIALALVALAVGGIHYVIALWRGNAMATIRDWRLAAIAILAGLALNLAVSFVGFGEVSVTPKHYPFALARSIEDGPALWYLERACPARGYAICELYPNGIPASNFEFLWGSNGISTRATPAQMDRIRAEEASIVASALAAYPFYQLEASLLNLWRQVSMIGIDPAIFHAIRLDGSGEVESGVEPTSSPWLIAVQRIVLAASLAFIAWRWRGLAGAAKGMVAFSLLLILANDAICGAISAPDIRYQNRVLWVIVLIALRLALLSPRGRDAGDAS